MTILIDPRNYAHVPVLLWPLVFLRLWSLYWWTRHHGREVIYHVTRDGFVIVDYVADDPRDLRAWMYRRQFTVPEHIYACHNDAGDLHLPDILILTTQVYERTGYLVRWVWVRIVMRALPSITDTS